MFRNKEGRQRVSSDLYGWLAGRLTGRDRWLCERLWESRVLTTTQIAMLCFASLGVAEHRLVKLYRWRVVDRFRPLASPGTGSAPFHYVLDEMGAAVLAASRGIDVADLPYRRDHALSVAHSPRLAHLVGVNDFMARLVAAARTRPDEARLVEWWPEARCRAVWGQVARPDAWGRWRDGGREIDFFLEYDRGTEDLGRVAGKLVAYGELAAATGIARTPVLVTVPGPRREVALRAAIGRTVVPVATMHYRLGAPDGPVWFPVGGPARRIRLAELGDLHTNAWAFDVRPVAQYDGNSEIR